MQAGHYTTWTRSLSQPRAVWYHLDDTVVTRTTRFLPEELLHSFHMLVYLRRNA